MSATIKQRMPTFNTLNGTLLVGAEAKRAWANQDARCNCGHRGEADASILGSDGDMPAAWLGCPNCSGSAVGLPLVYRTQSQITAINRESPTIDVIRWCQAMTLPVSLVGRWDWIERGKVLGYSVWITFGSTPAAEIQDSLKNAGFRWFHKCGDRTTYVWDAPVQHVPKKTRRGRSRQSCSQENHDMGRAYRPELARGVPARERRRRGIVEQSDEKRA